MPLATFSIFATWFGAETCIGAAGAVYEGGLSAGSADPFGYALCVLIMGLVYAVPLWKRRVTTIADVLRERFGTRVEWLAVLLIVPTSLLWAAAQMRAMGHVLSHVSGLESTVAMLVSAAVVVAYTVRGGLLADAVTDLIQGFGLLVGMVFLLIGVMEATGNPLTALERVDPARLALFGGPGASTLDTLEAWALPVFGSVVAQELVQRVLASKSPAVAQRSALLGGGLYLLVGLVPVYAGLIGATLLPDLPHPEQVLPALATRLLSPVALVLFNGALLSAILSTVDTTLLVSASLVSHNLVVPLRPSISEAGKVRLARSFVAAFGVIALIIALASEGVHSLVQQASGFGSAGFTLVVTLGLFTRFGGETAALWALLAGVVTWSAGAYWLKLAHPYLISLAAAACAYLAGASTERVLAARTRPQPTE
jgi:SSS family transporter